MIEKKTSFSKVPGYVQNNKKNFSHFYSILISLSAITSIYLFDFKEINKLKWEKLLKWIPLKENQIFLI